MVFGCGDRGVPGDDRGTPGRCLGGRGREAWRESEEETLRERVRATNEGSEEERIRRGRRVYGVNDVSFECYKEIVICEVL